MIKQELENEVVRVISDLYEIKVDKKQISIQKTRKEFEGDFTLVVFPLVKFAKKSPEACAGEIGEILKNKSRLVAGFNVIKGFLNLSLSTDVWLDFLCVHAYDEGFGTRAQKNNKPIVIEYSSPNTNKPLHLGHIRNNLLGHAIANILHAYGEKVYRVNLVNDRGIHICKTMHAYLKWGRNETPKSSGIKGDHFVGKYYVLFNQKHKEEMNALIQQGYSKEKAETHAECMQQARELLKNWEAGDAETIALWEKMNNWVYAGFDSTYQKLGICFDKTYYESETYLLGKKEVLKSYEKGRFIKKEDGSIWADLTGDGLDEKILLRSDGTSVYITQDVGTAILRQEYFNPSKLIYVVGNEQEYHFKALRLILKKTGVTWADNIHHLSYGMVELPEGKMKSREGKVVDADDLILQMQKTSEELTKELGKTLALEKQEAHKLFNIIAMGALKYFILKVDPRKKMLFNPEESIDFSGNTGPFIQYTYARIQSLFRKHNKPLDADNVNLKDIIPLKKELEIIKILSDYPEIIQQSAEELSPALLANYIYDLCRDFNQYYQETTILKADSDKLVTFRLSICLFVKNNIKHSMGLLGIDVPDRM